MNSLGRISLLFGALILLVFGVICLKQQIKPDPIQGDFASPENAGASPGTTDTRPLQPMILSGIGDENARTRPIELSPVPRSSNQAEQVAVPNQVPFLNGPMGTPNDSPGYSDSEPFPRDPPTTVSAAVLLAPVAVNNAIAERTTVDETPEFNSAVGGESAGHGMFPNNGTSRNDRVPMHTLPQTVVTVADDSLWNISKRLYGRGDFYKALWLHNQSVIPRPDRILPGIRLVAPNVDELRQLYPNACPASEDASASSS